MAQNPANQASSLGAQKFAAAEAGPLQLLSLLHATSHLLNRNKLAAVMWSDGFSYLWHWQKMQILFRKISVNWKSHTPSFLNSLWERLQSRMERKRCAHSLCRMLHYFLPAIREPLLTSPFTGRLTLLRCALLFKLTWANRVSEIAVSVRYSSNCLKISIHPYCLHTGECHPLTHHTCTLVMKAEMMFGSANELFTKEILSLFWKAAQLQGQWWSYIVLFKG